MPVQDRPARRRPHLAARRLAAAALRRGARRLDPAPARAGRARRAAAPAPQAQPTPLPAKAPAKAPVPTRAMPENLADVPRRPDGGVRIAAARDTFFRVLETTGDLGSAAAAGARAQMRAGATARARTVGRVLQQQGGATREIGDIVMAITAVHTQLSRTARELFADVELAEALRLAPAEYVRTAYANDPDAASAALADLLAGHYRTEADAAAWLDIARTSFLAGAEKLSAAALDRAEALATDLPAATRAGIAWLRAWYDRAGRQQTSSASAVAAFGVLDYRAPDRSVTSRDLGDYLESAAVIGLLSRTVRLSATDPELDAVVGDIRARLGDAAATGPDTVPLVAVPRDASSWSDAPDGTVLLVTGRLPKRLFGSRPDLPFDSRFRPVFVSVHAEWDEPLAAETLDQLRRYGPVGCRDHATVLLLQAAGVPAFFAGPVAATLGLLARGGDAGDAGDEELVVDLPGGISQDDAAVRTRTLAANLRAALGHLDAVAAAPRVRTSRLQTYLVAAASGTPVAFRPANRSARRLYGLLGFDDRAAAETRERLLGLTRAVTGAAPHGDDAIRTVWSAEAAPHVAAAEALRRDVPPMPPASIDVAEACATIRAGAVTVERRVAPGDDAGSEIAVEFSLDGNYKHQLEVVLDSIVVHTSRPVRAFVLCRDHTDADHDRMAALFPEVSFVWLPTDDVDYGPISGLLGYTTVATMDRLLLPELLPEVPRIVHHDLDAMCLADLGELFDVDFAGTPLAGRMSPQQSHVSGFRSLMRRSEHFPKRPGRGHELILRTHARLDYDFDVLNAGIMALDLDRMRADDFCREFLPYVERFGLNDQAVLNVYVGRNRVEVDPGWNWRPWLESLPEPKIAHWAGVFKPWKEAWVVGREYWRAGEARVEGRYARAGLRAAA